MKSKKVSTTGQMFSTWGAKVLKMAPTKKIKMIRDGVEVTLLVGAGQYYGIPQAKLSRLVGISDATITRKIKAGGKLSPQESERLTRIAAVAAEAEDMFSAPELAKRWMLESNLALGEAPLSLLDTDAGADEVRKILASIAYGCVA